jgi:hypothetical protein
MVWKPKERELTREEAIEEARKALAPFWYSSPPLFMASLVDSQVRIFPIDAAFEQKSWMVALLDPFSPQGVSALKFISQMHQRHTAHGLSTCVIFRSTYPFARDRDQLQAFLEDLRLPFPVTLDPDGQLHRGFEVSQPIGVSYRLYHAGVCQAKAEADVAPPSWESELQNFLRAQDPGLALRPAVDATEYDIKMQGITLKGGVASSPALRVLGKWEEDRQGGFSLDPHSALELDLMDGDVFVLADKQGKTNLSGVIHVTLNGMSVVPEDRGESLVELEDGETGVKVKRARLFHLIQVNEPKAGLQRLRLEACSKAEVKTIIYRVFVSTR